VLLAILPQSASLTGSWGNRLRNTSMDKCSYTFQTTMVGFSEQKRPLEPVALLPLAKNQHGKCCSLANQTRLRIREISLIQTYSPADLSCGDAHHAADPIQFQQSSPQSTASRRVVTTTLPGMALRESDSARCCKSFTELQIVPILQRGMPEVVGQSISWCS